MGSGATDKILLEVAGRAVFAHVLKAFIESETQDGFVVVARDDRQRRTLDRLIRESGLAQPVFFATGGRDRVESVRNGLEQLPDSTRTVTIHDCARPAVSPEAIRAVRKALEAHQCAVSLAHRLSDTIRAFADDPRQKPVHGRLVPREGLWAMETPQAFPRDLIIEAHKRLSGPATDDLAAVEALGKPVLILESPTPNPKLTRPADLPLLEALLSPNSMKPAASPPPFRVGYGYDIHRLETGRRLILGGVPIPSEKGLAGHSDADVLTHAIADAVLGGCGLPDIGHYFPNTDPSIAGIDSLRILEKACLEAANRGYCLSSLDATLIAEKPKIAPYIPRMKSRLADACGIDVGAIGIKATTQEGIGALGQAAGIAAHAVASLQRKESG
jgi:2-C-methyl-D-erythritol 4-phosphate cytidylyltransferase/2-C-methyl-D-erythritol 2,4-cyclodiphosphate synthase